MDPLSVSDILSGERGLYLLVFALAVLAAIKWLYDEWTGANYYRRYPIAKAMDELMNNGEMRGKDIMKALRAIDLAASKKIQAQQFVEHIRSQ